MEELINEPDNILYKEEFNKKINIKNISIVLLIIIPIILLILILTYFINGKNYKEDNNPKLKETIKYTNYIDNIFLKYNYNDYKINNDESFSFKAIYETKENENVNLISYKYKEYIIKMKIDEEYVVPSKNYTFKFAGNHTVYILMNITNLVKLDEMFNEISNLVYISFTKEFDTSNITSLRSMFYNCKKLSFIDITNFNAQSIADLAYLFSGCSSLSSIDISVFKYKNLKIMVSLFNGCSSLTSIDLSNFHTEYVTHMNNFFKGCSSLTSVNISNFNTKNVIYMEHMFDGCRSLTSLDVSNFNTAKVKFGEYMFSRCSNLTYLDISNFNDTFRSYSEFCAFLPSSGIIKLNKNIYEKISKFIPKNWEIIFIDN